MARYLALLRAINVGGHTVKMDRLRALFEALGFTHVETFIASGNVVFEAGAAKTETLEKKIERHLAESLGYPVDTFVRTLDDLAAIAACQPFAPEQHADPANNLYILFLRSAPSAAEARSIVDCGTDVDTFAVRGRELYWLRRTNLSDANHPPPPFEKHLNQSGTLRNSTTVRRMAARFAGAPAPAKKKRS
jgi:uncharacterized protein (DUF1697 family)